MNQFLDARARAAHYGGVQPSEYEELDWDEGIDLAERVEVLHAENLKLVMEAFQQMLENNAVQVSNSIVQMMNAMSRG